MLLPDGGRGYLSKIFNDEWMADYGFLAPSAAGRPSATCSRGKAGRDARRSCTSTRTRRSRDAIDILREYDVSQMPVVRAEPPVMAAEVVGSVGERDLLDALFDGPRRAGRRRRAAHVAAAADRSARASRSRAAIAALARTPTRVVLVDGKPAACSTRSDVLGFLAAGTG